MSQENTEMRDTGPQDPFDSSFEDVSSPGTTRQSHSDFESHDVELQDLGPSAQTGGISASSESNSSTNTSAGSRMPPRFKSRSRSQFKNVLSQYPGSNTSSSQSVQSPITESMLMEARGRLKNMPFRPQPRLEFTTRDFQLKITDGLVKIALSTPLYVAPGVPEPPVLAPGVAEPPAPVLAPGVAVPPPAPVVVPVVAVPPPAPVVAPVVAVPPPAPVVAPVVAVPPPAPVVAPVVAVPPAPVEPALGKLQRAGIAARNAGVRAWLNTKKGSKNFGHLLTRFIREEHNTAVIYSLPQNLNTIGKGRLFLSQKASNYEREVSLRPFDMEFLLHLEDADAEMDKIRRTVEAWDNPQHTARLHGILEIPLSQDQVNECNDQFNNIRVVIRNFITQRDNFNRANAAIIDLEDQSRESQFHTTFTQYLSSKMQVEVTVKIEHLLRNGIDAHKRVQNEVKPLFTPHTAARFNEISADLRELRISLLKLHVHSRIALALYEVAVQQQ